MKKNSYFPKTFGQNWKLKIVLLTISVIIISIIPSFILRDRISFSAAKFSEDWFKNTFSISILFVFANYLNYSISYHRNKDKLLMLLTKLNLLCDDIILSVKEQTNPGLNLKIKIIERVINKIQNEEEFLYAFENFNEFKDYSLVLSPLYNINFNNQISAESREAVLNKINNIKDTFSNLNERI